jgi:transposase
VAFREISNMDIWEVIRRWHEHESISQIARSLGYDRKTVRHFIRLAQSTGLSPTKALPAKDAVLALLDERGATGGRTPLARCLLDQYLEELIDLVHDEQHGLPPKHAFDVLCERHGLHEKVSYSSFKRFIRSHWARFYPEQVTCRIEVEPGSELQIDYGRAGLLFDPLEGHKRVLYAFVGTLAHSRHKYIELVFTQDQTSFVSSHVRMFEYFGGVPGRVVLDNLKAGVAKPDLYDPHFNRAYQELAEHYHFFIDACRVAHPQDKGKVERDVRTVRAAVRKLLVLYPTASLAELNRLVKRWAEEDYGRKPHGTTREMPFVVFSERERPRLRQLPPEQFEVAEWKQATVHPDHYIQFKGKAYSVATPYIGKKVWIRATERIIQVFCDGRLIKEHVKGRGYRHTDSADFPQNVQAVLHSSLHKHLLSQAEAIGPHFLRLVRTLLEIEAFINLRKVQGLLSIAQREDRGVVEQAAAFITTHHMQVHPRIFRALIDKLQLEHGEGEPLSLSQETLSFVRDATYFIHPQEHDS